MGLLAILGFCFILCFPWVQGQTCYSTLDFTSQNGSLHVNGHPFLLKGLSWFGYETSINVFHGLWNVDYRDLLDFIASNGFNAIRVPFYLDLVLHDANPVGIVFYNHNGSRMNMPLANMTSLQALDKIIQDAATRGLLIMLDLHSFEADAYASNGLWYDSSHPESLVVSGWQKLVQRYANQWNVIAFDLKNEPFQTTWNTGVEATDWNAAASRIGNEILGFDGGNRFLIFVEGTASSPPCAQNCFFGENLQGVANAPVKLSQPNKLVYSPHVYGPSVYTQPYFSDPTFPANMPAIWQTHFGFVPNQTGNAIVIGEWGGLLGGASEVWLDAFVSWLISNNFTDQFFWCLNPDSADTGGLLEADWVTPVVPKLQLLQKLASSPTKFTVQNGQICIS